MLGLMPPILLRTSPSYQVSIQLGRSYVEPAAG